MTPTISSAQVLPAFPGAEGFGGSFSGTAPAGGWFSNATIYHVTNLNDSGPGSFRGAFAENSSNRIIVFDVAGTIHLTSDNIDIKNLSNYYIAGQTAPGPVTIYGDMVQLTHSSGKENRNVVLRYLSFRKGTGDNSDAITFAGSGLGTNLILDHVSASWSEDEILSVANNNTNVTVQYSLIHDALVSNHAYGSLIRPRISSNVTFHHNLYAHNASRQARFGTYNGEKLTAEFTNNVVYNWRDRASYAGGSAEAEQEFVDVNFIGNYFIAGPGTGSNTTRTFIVDKNTDVRAYQFGNFVDSDKQLNPGGQPNGADTGWNMFMINNQTDQSLTQMNTPFEMAPVIAQSADDAYWQVVNHAGNWWWARDAIDARVIENVKTNTGPQIGAAAPPANELNGLLNAPAITRPADWDTDGDGMPNFWETAHGLNPNSAADNKLDFDNDGYVNVVEYLNDVGAFPAPEAAVWTGGDGRYALTSNWSTWQPSRFDTVKINSGTATVDAAGQHAANVHVGHDDGSEAALVISGGWLDVEDSVRVGAGPSSGRSGSLVLSGGVLRVGGLLHVDNTGSVQFNGGAIDIEAGSAIFESDGGSSAELLNAMAQQIDSARAGGAWNGPGIRSALAAADPATFGIGIARNGDLAVPWAVFAGENVSEDSILVRATVLGDTNLDGTVNITDLAALASSWEQPGVWSSGDFDGNGIVDVGDLQILAGHWELSGGSATSLHATLTSMGLPTIGVPEPGTLSLVGLLFGAAGLSRRHRN